MTTLRAGSDLCFISNSYISFVIPGMDIGSSSVAGSDLCFISERYTLFYYVWDLGLFSVHAHFFVPTDSVARA